MIYVIPGMANKDKNEDNKERERERTHSPYNRSSYKSMFVRLPMTCLSNNSNLYRASSIINRTSNHVLIILL